jgi:hypothetical protein
MSDNTTTSGDAAIETGQPTSAPRYRVHGSIRLHVTVTAAHPDEATRAVPGVVTAAFAGLPGIAVSSEGLAIGMPKPLRGVDVQPIRHQVPVTVHGHVDIVPAYLTSADDTNLPYDALNMVAEHLDGRDDVTADLDSAVCEQVTQVTDTQPIE